MDTPNKSSIIGKIDTCPYCSKKLDLIPSKKKKCKDCGQYIYVKTRPEDRKKVLVTEKQKDEIELQWQQYYQKNEEDKLMQNQDFISAKEELTKQFGKNPSMDDIKWKVYNQRIVEYASKRQWGLYRNNKLDMANLLITEGRHKQALITLFEICYLDLNGGNNVGGGMSNEDMGRMGIYEFDTKMAFLAPGIVSMVQDGILTLGLDDDSAKRLFVDTNNQNKPKKNMPLTTDDAWTKLSAQIQKNSRLQAINPTDTKSIFNEIDDLIGKNEYSDAAQLIYTIKSGYYSKKEDFPDANDIKKHLPELLNSNQTQISNAAESLLLTMAKKDYGNVSDIMEEYVKKIQREEDVHAESNILGKIAAINIELVKPLIPKLIKNLKDQPEWNARRSSAFNIGMIGSKNPELVNDAIPVMIDYIKKPYEVTKREPITVQANGFTFSMDMSPEKMLGVDQTQWLKDAYIDSIGMIAKGDKNRILEYKSLFEEIAKKDKSEYSRKKALQVLDIITK